MNRRSRLKKLRSALETASKEARRLRRLARENETPATVDRAMAAEAAAADAEFRLAGFLETRSADELRRGDVIEVDRDGEPRNGDDVCRVVRPLRRVGSVFVIYVLPASEPAEGDEAAWLTEDVEELVVRAGERFRLVSRKAKAN